MRNNRFQRLLQVRIENIRGYEYLLVANIVIFRIVNAETIFLAVASFASTVASL